MHLLVFISKVYLYSFFNVGARWGWVDNVTSRPLYPRKRTLYPSYRRLVGPQGRSGRVRKISPPLEFDSRSKSLYWLHYHDSLSYSGSRTYWYQYRVNLLQYLSANVLRPQREREARLADNSCSSELQTIDRCQLAEQRRRTATEGKKLTFQCKSYSTTAWLNINSDAQFT